MPLSALPLALELGYLIAAPLVVFALLGRLGDRTFGTSPWLLLVGVFFASLLSLFIVYRKISRYLA